MTWLKVAGEEDAALERKLDAWAQEKRGSKEFSTDDEYYIAKLTRSVVREGIDVSEKRLELLRDLCRLHHVELIPPVISSHRKIVGPIIVAFKKILFRMLRPFLDETMKRQRAFNASVVYMVSNLVEEGTPSAASGSRHQLLA